MDFDKNFSYFSRLSLIITTSHDNKPTHSVSSFVLKTNHAHRFFFLFFFRNAMVSIYSLRPVYTFLYTINGNAIAFFVQKKKSFEILWSKIIFFFAYVRNLEPPPYPLYAIVRTWLDPSPPHLCVRTRWMTPSPFENIWFPKVKHNGARRYLTDKFDTKYSRVDQVNFVEDSLYKFEGIWSA